MPCPAVVAASVSSTMTHRSPPGGSATGQGISYDGPAGRSHAKGTLESEPSQHLSVTEVIMRNAILAAAVSAVLARPVLGQPAITVSPAGLAPTAVAVQDVAELRARLDRIGRRVQAQPLLADPSISALAASGHQGVTVETTKDGTTGKIRLARSVLNNTFDLVIKGPVSSSGAGVLATDGGLSSGASARVGVQRAVALRARVRDLPSAVSTRTMEGAAAWLTAIRANKGNYRLQRKGQAEPRFVEAPDVAGTAELAFADGSVAVEQAWYWALGFERAMNKFRFMPLPAVEPLSVTRWDSLLSGSLGYGRMGTPRPDTSAQPLFYVGVSGEFGRRHDASDASNVCTPVSNSTATTCRSISTAGPVRQDADILKVELRQWFRDQELGLNPQLVFDRAADSARFEFNVSSLVYKRKDTQSPYELDQKALSAGVKTAWTFRGREKGPSISVFISTVLGGWQQ